jgi:murein DD-endopeptidase MepM/ murein hydrolase activator NlpD
VRTGQRLGEVGATGNARTVGCHLHFELHGPGGPFDPLPDLGAWDGWS